MSSNPSLGKWLGILIAGIAVVAVVIAAILLAPPQQSGDVGCLFYSAYSRGNVYNVYATLFNNSTSPVTIIKVYLDGAEQAYNSEPVQVGGIWSMKVDGNPTKVLDASGTGTLYVTAAGANPDLSHAVRIVTNESYFEFNTVKKLSSLSFDHYDVFIGPGIDYTIAYIDNVGTAAGDIVEVAMDGTLYDYVLNALPPNSAGKWSMVVEGRPTSFIGAGQEGKIYIDTSTICHSCTHMIEITCSDGSNVAFSFRPW